MAAHLASECPEGFDEPLTSDADMQPTQNLPPGRWAALTLDFRLKTPMFPVRFGVCVQLSCL